MLCEFFEKKLVGVMTYKLFIYPSSAQRYIAYWFKLDNDLIMMSISALSSS